MKNRSRMDIVGLILNVSIEGATKWKIMDKAYLTVLQLKDYPFLLLENGLLGCGKGNGIYKTTERGLRVLDVTMILVSILVELLGAGNVVCTFRTK